MFSGSVIQCSMVYNSVLAPLNFIRLVERSVHWRCCVHAHSNTGVRAVYTGAARRRSVGGGFPQGADVSLAKLALNNIRESNRKERKDCVCVKAAIKNRPRKCKNDEQVHQQIARVNPMRFRL